MSRERKGKKERENRYQYTTGIANDSISRELGEREREVSLRVLSFPPQGSERTRISTRSRQTTSANIPSLRDDHWKGERKREQNNNVHLIRSDPSLHRLDHHPFLSSQSSNRCYEGNLL